MNSKYILSISCGNYLFSNGGTDKVIRAQQKLFSEKSISYVFLFPIMKQIGKIMIYGWGINIDDKFCGVYSSKGIEDKLLILKMQNAECLQIHIHNLWRVRTEELQKYLDLYNCDIKFYLHDYHAVCRQGNLMRDGVEFCGEIDGLCKNEKCSFFDLEYVKKIRRFFDKYVDRLEFIAPSQSVADNFRSILRCNPKRVHVVKHQKLIGQYKENWDGTLEQINIAYVGTQTKNKGWDEYKKIVYAVNEKTQYSFYYFGVGQERINGVETVYTSIKQSGDNAMLTNLRSNQINVVLLLSCWPETYSYTFFEGMAANCFVIAYDCSGNIAREIRTNRNGRVFKNTNEIIAYLSTDDSLRKDIKAWYKGKNYGPEKLVDNDEIFEIVINGKTDDKKVAHKKHHAIINRKVVLELVYRVRKKR